MIYCDCPRCGSRNTKALPVVYGNGTRDFTYRRDGWYYSRRSFGVHSSRTRGRSQTLAAQWAAPPADSHSATAVVITAIIVLSLALGGVTGFILVFGVIIALAAFAAPSPRDPSEDSYQNWASTFRCERCGLIFRVNAEETPLPITTVAPITVEVQPSVAPLPRQVRR